MRNYTHKKNHIWQDLHSTISSIHFTLDLWSSTNHLSLLGIVVHYTDENGSLQQSVLVLQKVEGQYTGKNLASIMLSVAEEYQIWPKLGFFIGDTADNNDTMI